MNELMYNPILEEMKIKEVNRNRTINFLGEFNEDNCYKCECCYNCENLSY